VFQDCTWLSKLFYQLRITAANLSSSIGLRLLSLSNQESGASGEGSRRRNIPSLTRQLYIHGTTYAIRGLPENLNEDEILSLSASLPAAVMPSSVNGYDQTRRRPSMQPQRSAARSPSILHHIIATIILQLCLLFQFLAPYIRNLAATLAAIEREHHLTERLMRSSARGTEALVQLGNRICALDEGRVGQVLEDIVVWCIRSIVGGVRQGLGDGIAALGGEK
jgi:hypothetical protein